MDVRRPLAVLFLACFLLSACTGTPPPRSHRQKRGLTKMMMHIMWDPVRLIRYWHVYDVSKEIAKSWRKILPTIMLLPVTNSNPHSYSGIAKYVHPTNGFRKNYPKHRKTPLQPHYLKSAGSVQPVAMPPQSAASFPHYDFPQQYFTSASEAANLGSHQYDYSGMSPVVVGHVPYGEGQNQHTVAHYYMKDGNIRNHRIQHPSPIHDHIRSSSSQHVSRAKENVQHYYPSSENHIHYVPEADEPTSVHDDSEKGGPLVLQPGQEFRVVLHPIPVRDFDPRAPPPEGHSMQFVPVHAQDHHSRDSNSPMLFKAVSRDVAEDHPHYQEEASSEEFHIDRSGAEKKSPKGKNEVTWVARKSLKNSPRRKDPELSKVLPVQKFRDESEKNSSLGNETNIVRKTFGLHRYNINMEQLREDLKHGTPVLIPFNKNAFAPDGVTEVADPSTTVTQSSAVVSADNHSAEVQGHSGDERDSQRLLLFLKKKNS